MELFKQKAQEIDIIITAALASGKPAPKLITKEVINVMKSGAVTVDLAAETGGNIETTVTDDVFVTGNGVSCIGYTDLPARMGAQGSSAFSDNISNFLLSMGPHTGVLLPYICYICTSVPCSAESRSP